MNKEEDTRKKIEFFYKYSLKVHITKRDGFFYNGFFEGNPEKDVYEFEDDKIGRCILFMSDIMYIKKYEERR